jgi:hypothetical protein
MNAECGMRNAESPASAWEQRRRVLILLVACLDVPTVVCRAGGVLRRGSLGFDGRRFCVGPLVIHPEQVGAVTLERDLLTLHVGDIA